MFRHTSWSLSVMIFLLYFVAVDGRNYYSRTMLLASVIKVCDGQQHLRGGGPNDLEGAFDVEGAAVGVDDPAQFIEVIGEELPSLRRLRSPLRIF